MRTILCALIALMGVTLYGRCAWSSASTQPAGVTVQFPPGMTEVTVKLVRANELLLVPVQFNGQDCGLFLLDTGASHLQIDLSLAKQLGLPQVGKGTMSAVGGEQPFLLYAVDGVATGGVAVGPTFVGASDLSGMAKELGLERLDGVLGNEFLKHMPFTIDWYSGNLVLYDPAKFIAPESISPEQLVMIDGIPTVRASVENALVGQFSIDTGSNASLVLGVASARLHRYWLNERPWQRSLLIGAAGLHDSRMASFDRLDVMGSCISPITMDYSYEPGATVSELFAGTIGMPVLRSFEMTMDYRHGKIWAKRCPLDTVPAEWTAPQFDPRHPDATGMTALMLAAAMGRDDYVSKFIASGSDVNACDREGLTALHRAATQSNERIVRIFLSAGAAVNAKTRDDTLPLHIAAAGASRAVVSELLDHGADLEATDVFGRTALVAAAEAGNVDIVTALLKAGAKANVVSASSGSPLHAAAQRGFVEVARVLLTFKADPNLVDKRRGNTPVLYVAAMGGNAELVRLLIASGATVDAIAGDGQTALFPAAARGQDEVVRVLLANGADADVVDKENMTALDVATANYRFETMLLLRAYKKGAMVQQVATDP